MFAGAKCLLEKHVITPSASGGVTMEIDVAVWESSILPDDYKLQMRFLISPGEAIELAKALSAAATDAVLSEGGPRQD